MPALAIIGPVREPTRERTLYEIASIFFAAVVVAFALGGMTVAGLSDGVASSGFGICALFLLLGLGRLYFGLRRPGSVEARRPTGPSSPAPDRRRPAAGRPSRPPPRRRRP